MRPIAGGAVAAPKTTIEFPILWPFIAAMGVIARCILAILLLTSLCCARDARVRRNRRNLRSKQDPLMFAAGDVKLIDGGIELGEFKYVEIVEVCIRQTGSGKMEMVGRARLRRSASQADLARDFVLAFNEQEQDQAAGALLHVANIAPDSIETNGEEGAPEPRRPFAAWSRCGLEIGPERARLGASPIAVVPALTCSFHASRRQSSREFIGCNRQGDPQHCRHHA